MKRVKMFIVEFEALHYSNSFISIRQLEYSGVIRTNSLLIG